MQKQQDGPAKSELVQIVEGRRGSEMLTVPRVLRKSARCFRLILDRIDLPIVERGFVHRSRHFENRWLLARELFRDLFTVSLLGSRTGTIVYVLRTTAWTNMATWRTELV